jgi:hypothetical protein
MKTNMISVLSLSCLLIGVTTTRAQIVLSPERTGHAATLFDSGKVLITGGINSATLNSALLYDPTGVTTTSTE